MSPSESDLAPMAAAACLDEATAAAAPFLVVAGPTASGKSTLALHLATSLGGEVINADSLQVYRDLAILSARPTPAEMARAPHALYGVLDGAEVCSVGRWLGLAREAVGRARAAGRLPILVGGTGLYLKAALEGLARLPAVPPAARAEARRLLAEEGAAALHDRLARLDPEMAQRLRPSDSQRLARAYEVITGTGRSLAAWWADGEALPPLSGRGGLILVDPPRLVRRQACDDRLAAMVAMGGLDELAALLARRLDPALPVMRAVGLPELAAHLTEGLPLAEALARAQAATRRYAKRQGTWARHQMRPDLILDQRVDAQYLKSPTPELANFLRVFVLTPGD